MSCHPRDHASQDGIGRDGLYRFLHAELNLLAEMAPPQPCADLSRRHTAGVRSFEREAITKDVAAVSALGKTSSLGDFSQFSAANKVRIEDALSNQQTPTGL